MDTVPAGMAGMTAPSETVSGVDLGSASGGSAAKQGLDGVWLLGAEVRGWRCRADGRRRTGLDGVRWLGNAERGRGRNRPGPGNEARARLRVRSGYGVRARREPATVGTTVRRMIVRLGLRF
jgi:hypothetical protein